MRARDDQEMMGRGHITKSSEIDMQFIVRTTGPSSHGWKRVKARLEGLETLEEAPS
jgi:hypothetical protein